MRALWLPLELRMEIFLLLDFTGLELGIVLNLKMLRQIKGSFPSALLPFFKKRSWDETATFLEECFSSVGVEVLVAVETSKGSLD